MLAFACTGTALADEVHLKDGTVLKGDIVKSDGDTVMLKHPHLGYKIIQRSDIEKIVAESTEKPEEPVKAPERKDSPEAIPDIPLSDPETHAKFTSLLGRLSGENTISQTELADRLVQLGPKVVSSILQYISNNPESGLLDVMFKVLLRLKDEKTASYISQFLKSGSQTAVVAAITALKKIGSGEAIRVLLDSVLTGKRETSLLAREALLAILQGNPDNYEVFNPLKTKADSSDNSTKIFIINFLGLTKSRVAADMVSGYLNDWDVSVKKAAISSLGKLGFSNDAVCSALRKFLDDRDPRLKKEAALALGRLQDLESVEPLMTLLKDKDRGVQGNALWALRKISGLKFPLNYQRWKIWWDRESQETMARKDELLSKLRDGTREELLDAIDKLAGIRLGRKQVLNAFRGLLNHGDPEVRRAVCSALGTINAKEAVPQLIELLDDSSEPVITAAHQALRRITGKNLPPSRKAWSQ